jgi:hypothetical protein
MHHFGDWIYLGRVQSSVMLAVCFCRSPRVRETYRFYQQGENNRLARNDCSLLRLLVTANVAPTSPILVILLMEVIRAFETSRVTPRNIPEDGILHSHRRESLKSYIALTGWAL